ncbi:MAG: hypothetical protein KBE41_02960 [Lutibacter sp.]|nr:hypothetical protein [Lutibacter sp.]MBP9600439.1 hypothetical protein [Lutibacter sp.]
MKKFIGILVISLLIYSCGTQQKKGLTFNKNLPEGAVRIVNDSLEYEIIIIDAGFETYLNSISQPANFYSQQFYEGKNKFYVTEWNIRAKNPMRYDNSIYENEINYDSNTDYGLDVNYKLYNYFKFVEHKYKQVFFN